MNKNSLSLLLLLAIGHTAHAGFGDFVKTYICCCCCPQTDDQKPVELQELIPDDSQKRTRVETTGAQDTTDFIDLSKTEQPNTLAARRTALEAVFVGTQRNLLASKKATGGTQR